jgi:hypothetical protein
MHLNLRNVYTLKSAKQTGILQHRQISREVAKSLKYALTPFLSKKPRRLNLRDLNSTKFAA